MSRILRWITRLENQIGLGLFVVFGLLAVNIPIDNLTAMGWGMFYATGFSFLLWALLKWAGNRPRSTQNDNRELT